MALNDPDPFEVRVTLVALPANVFPETVSGIVPHVLSTAWLSETEGPFIQPQLTSNIPERVVQDWPFLTAR